MQQFHEGMYGGKVRGNGGCVGGGDTGVGVFSCAEEQDEADGGAIQ